MSLTILVTGFGPFPGAAFNPTRSMAIRLARLRRPALSDVKIIAHVFPTSYAAVDRELPLLVARHKPQAMLMFGLAPRARAVRVETRARNAVALLPDADGISIRRNVIAPGRPASVPLRTPVRQLLAALRTACAVNPSRDAGRYLCNYLCWRVSDLAADRHGPKTLAFIHVPPVRRGARRKGPTRQRRKAMPSIDNLVAAAGRALVAIVAEARR